MSYTIQADPAPRESFGDYRYRIFCNGRLVARYWHDFRGDEHGIDFVGGKSVEWPVGRMVEFIKGGGPEPLGLSSRAIAFLEQMCC